MTLSAYSARPAQLSTALFREILTTGFEFRR